MIFYAPKYTSGVAPCQSSPCMIFRTVFLKHFTNFTRIERRRNAIPCLPRICRRSANVPRCSTASANLDSCEKPQPLRNSRDEGVLQNVRSTLLLSEEVVYRGTGRHLGMDVAWQLRCRPDGAFVEEIRGRHLSWCWGYSGGPTGVCWEVDDAGVSKKLELDDLETCVISTWVRTGFWAQEDALQMLQVEVLEHKDVLDSPLVTCETSRGDSPAYLPASEPSCSPLQQPHNNDHTPVVLKVQLKNGKLSAQVHVCGVSWHVLGVVQQVCGNVETWATQEWSTWDGGQQAIAAEAATPPQQATAPHHRNAKRSRTHSGNTTVGIYPRRVVHFAAAGGEHSYLTTEAHPALHFSGPPKPWDLMWSNRAAILHHLLPIGGPRGGPSGGNGGPPQATWHTHLSIMMTTQAGEQQQGGWGVPGIGIGVQNLCEMPPPELLPRDTVFDVECGSSICCWQTPSGHVLLRPLINGQQVGYCILDTGASGFVLERGVADRLGLEGFGELYVQGMTGQVRSQFRRGTSFRVGPLTMQRPLFMEMQLAGIVSGAPGPVVGIVGYDLFRRAVVELPANNSKNNRTVECKITLHHPEHYNGDNISWQELQMIANLPYVRGSFHSGCTEGDPSSTLFMLDSGAGGVDVIFHNAVVEELGLLDPTNPAQRLRKIKGIGGQQSINARTVELDWLALGDMRFGGVRCLMPDAGSVQMSLYTVGIICSDLLRRSTMIIDLPRNRVAFVKPSE